MEPNIKRLILHQVGNKVNDEKISLSKSLLEIDLKTDTLLNKYFFSSIKKGEYFNFHHDSRLALNEIYTYVTDIFDNELSFVENSKNIAKHLYDCSGHPKIKGGNLYVVYFSNCQVEDNTTNAIGIFKSESEDTFIKVRSNSNGFEIYLDSGANINRLDKGCIIYNVEKENGYLVSIVDNLSKSGLDAQYWRDDFLHVKSRKDEFFHTKSIISLCKNFINDYLTEDDTVTKVDQIDFLNKASNFLNENTDFNMEIFTNQVFSDENKIIQFKDFRKNYETETEAKIEDDFQISREAVKRQSRSLKNTIKLDKNFRILVDGDRAMMKKGFDEELGMHFYTLYYKDEI